MGFKLADVDKKRTGNAVESAGLVPKMDKQLGFADVMYTDPFARYLLAASVGGAGYHLLKNLLTPRKYKEYMRAKPLSSKFMELFKDIATGALISAPAAFAYPYLYGMFRGTSDLPPPDVSRMDFSSYLSGDKPIENKVNQHVAENLKRIGHDYRFLESPDDERIWPSGFMGRAAVYVPTYIVANWNRISPIHRLMAAYSMKDIDDYGSILSKYRALYGDDSPIVRSVAAQLAENTGDTNFIRRLMFYLRGPKPYEISSDAVNTAIREMYDLNLSKKIPEIARGVKMPGAGGTSQVLFDSLSRTIENLPEKDLKELLKILNISDYPRLAEVLEKIEKTGIKDPNAIANIIKSEGLPEEFVGRIRAYLGGVSREIPDIPKQFISSRFIEQEAAKEFSKLEGAAYEFAGGPPPIGRTLGKNVYSTADFVAAAGTIAGMTDNQIRALSNRDRLILLRSLFGGTGASMQGAPLFIDALRKMKGSTARGSIFGPVIDAAESLIIGANYSDIIARYGPAIAGTGQSAPITDSVMLKLKKLFDDPRVKAFLSDRDAIEKFLESSDVLSTSKGSITRSGIISKLSDDLSRVITDVSNQATINKMAPLSGVKASLTNLGNTASDYIRIVQSANLDQEARLARVFPIFTHGSAAINVQDPQIGKLFLFAEDAGIDLNSYKFTFSDVMDELKKLLPGVVDVDSLFDLAKEGISDVMKSGMNIKPTGITFSPKNRNAYMLAYGLNKVMSPHSDAFKRVVDYLNAKHVATKNSRLRDLAVSLENIKNHLDITNTTAFGLVDGELVVNLPGVVGQFGGAQASPARQFIDIISDKELMKYLDEAIENVYKTPGIAIANRDDLAVYMAARNIAVSDIASDISAATKGRLSNMSGDEISRFVAAIIAGDTNEARRILGPIDRRAVADYAIRATDIRGPQAARPVASPHVLDDIREEQIRKIISAIENANESTLMDVVEFIDKTSDGSITRFATNVRGMKDSEIARNMVDAIEKVLAEKGSTLSSADRESMRVLKSVLSHYISPSAAEPHSHKLAGKIISAVRKGQVLKQNLKLPIVSTPITRHADDLVAAGRGGRMFGYLKKSPAVIAGIDATISILDLLMNLNDPNLHKYRLTSSTMDEIRSKGFRPTDPRVIMSIVLDSAEKSNAGKSSNYPLTPPVKKDNQYDITSINRFIDDLIKYVAANDTTFFENLGYRVGGGDISSSVDVAKKAYNIAKTIENGVPLLYSTDDGGQKTVTVRPEWISDVIKVMSERFPGLVGSENSSISNILGLQ